MSDMIEQLEAKEYGKYYTCVCPSCNEKEGFFYKDKPQIISCNRKNSCGKRNFVVFDDEAPSFSVGKKSDGEITMTKQQHKEREWLSKLIHYKSVHNFAESSVLDSEWRGLSPETLEGFAVDLRSEKTVTAMFARTKSLASRGKDGGLKDYTKSSYMTARNLVFPVYGDDGLVDGLLMRSTLNPDLKTKEIFLPINKENPRMVVEDIPKGAKTIVIAESVIDGLSFREIDKDVGILMMTGANRIKQVMDLIEQNPQKFKDSEFVLAMDNDEAGVKAQGKLAEYLSKQGYNHVPFKYPDGHKDPNDFLQKDKRKFRQYLSLSREKEAKEQSLSDRQKQKKKLHVQELGVLSR